MPLDPGMARSLAIFARSVIFFSFSSARLILIGFISLVQLKISLKLRPGTALAADSGPAAAGNSFSDPVSQAGKSGADKIGPWMLRLTAALRNLEAPRWLVRLPYLGAEEPRRPSIG